MEIVQSLENLTNKHRGSIAAIGNFDGVHLGHQKVLQLTKELAKNHATTSSIITFEPHPREFFQTNPKPFRLSLSSSRARSIQTQGIDYLFELPFNGQLANLSAEEFISQYLCKLLNICHVVVGKDFRFGKERVGDYPFLVQQGKKFGFGVSSLELFQFDNTTCSSTRIREAITNGEVIKAAESLGHWFGIEGTVGFGQQRGKKLGYPTANLDLDRVIHPKKGIYCVLIEILTGSNIGNYTGVCSIGNKPTFGNYQTNLETYIFDFNETIYGEVIEVKLIQYLRPEYKFDNEDLLIKQMKKDCQNALSVLRELDLVPKAKVNQ